MEPAPRRLDRRFISIERPNSGGIKELGVGVASHGGLFPWFALAHGAAFKAAGGTIQDEAAAFLASRAHHGRRPVYEALSPVPHPYLPAMNGVRPGFYLSLWAPATIRTGVSEQCRSIKSPSQSSPVIIPREVQAPMRST